MFRLKKMTIDIGIVCSNFEESLRFYHDLLGLEIVLRISYPRGNSFRSVPGTNWIPSSVAQSGRYLHQVDGNHVASW